MYKVKWDTEINGVLLDNKISDMEAIVPPRPVFFEELNLLGFDKYCDYPESESPLLWASGRRYYYKGECIAEARGGNIYESPELSVTYKGRLKPINLQLLTERNKEAISTLENEAMDFVQHVHKKYREKTDYFAVSFSGGKDSQVVLDIVSRVLGPDEYMVIFTDTGMEIPFTHENVAKTEKAYKTVYPGLKFYTAKPPKDTLQFWKEFGPPSRLQRWCCSVCKTAPFAKLIQNIHEEKGVDGQPKILVFDGVRSDESNMRSNYKRIAKGVKYRNQINAEVIQEWSVSEVFLYLFYRINSNETYHYDLLNKGYRYGLNRIGCSICPFATGWSENIITKIGGNKVENFVNVIRDHVLLLGIKDENKLRSYIMQGQWKKRGGGEGLDNSRGIDFIEKNNNLTAILFNPGEDMSDNILEWLKVAGEILFKRKDNLIEGEIKIDDNIFPFEISNNREVRFYGLDIDISVKNRIKTILYKTTYCVHCGVCEAVCPNNAIRVIPAVRVNSNLCVNCYKCLNFKNRGCLMASSIFTSEGTKKMIKKFDGFGKYLTFGLRKVWLSSFLNKLDFNAATEECRLGNKQKDSLKTWLKDAELLKSSPTETAILLSEILKKNEKFVWEIIWINLFYNSSVCKWFSTDIAWQSTYNKDELVNLLKNQDETINERTMESGINSLLNTFKDDKPNIATPLGKELKIGLIEKKGATRYVNKIGTDEIHPMAIAYSLYKFAEDKRRYDLTVAEFYNQDCEGGPYKLFGISKFAFENNLRTLQEDKNQIVRVDLAADLDNIFLREDITSSDILKMMDI